MAAKEPDSGTCIFCRSSEDNVERLGKKYTKDTVSVHYFCMLFASGLSQKGRTDKDGILGFLLNDIKREAKRSSRLKCELCKEPFATIGCVVTKCKEKFHFPCGLANGVLNQYFGTFCSFCEEHRPRQSAPSTGRLAFKGTAKAVCSICMSAVQARASNTTLKAPCCGNSWFHRECIQRMATCSGIHFFKCPLCNSMDLFQNEMLEFGIYIPDQDAAWEQEPNAYHELLERHSRCDVAKCGCNHGRNYNKDGSKWEIMLCDWCGSAGTHLACSRLKTAMDDWVCKDCIDAAGNPGSKSGKKSKKKMISPSGVPGIPTTAGQKKWLVHKMKAEAKPDVPLRKRKAGDSGGGKPVKKRRKLSAASSTVTLSQLSAHSPNSLAKHTVERKKKLLLSITPLKVNSSTVKVKCRRSGGGGASSSSMDYSNKKRQYRRHLGSQFSTITSPVLSSRPRSESRYLMQKPNISFDVASSLLNSRDLQNLLNQDIFTGRNLGDKLKDIYLPPDGENPRRSPNMPVLFPEQSSRARVHSRKLQQIPNIELEATGSPLNALQVSNGERLPNPNLDDTLDYSYDVGDAGLLSPDATILLSPATRARYRSLSKTPASSAASSTAVCDESGLILAPYTRLEPPKSARRNKPLGAIDIPTGEALQNGFSSVVMAEEELARPLNLLPLPDDCLSSPKTNHFPMESSTPMGVSNPVSPGLNDQSDQERSGTPHSLDLSKSDSSLARSRKPIQFPDINDEKLPKWAKRLLDDDVIQGKNLGEKFVRQYQPEAQVGQPKYTNHLWKLLPFKKRPYTLPVPDKSPQEVRVTKKARRRRDRKRPSNENCPSPDSLPSTPCNLNASDPVDVIQLKSSPPSPGEIVDEKTLKSWARDQVSLDKLPFQKSPSAEKWAGGQVGSDPVGQRRTPRSAQKWVRSPVRSPLARKAEKSPLGHFGGTGSKPRQWDHQEDSAMYNLGQSTGDEHFTLPHPTYPIPDQMSPRARIQATYHTPPPPQSPSTARHSDTEATSASTRLYRTPSRRRPLHSPSRPKPRDSETHSPVSQCRSLGPYVPSPSEVNGQDRAVSAPLPTGQIEAPARREPHPTNVNSPTQVQNHIDHAPRSKARNRKSNLWNRRKSGRKESKNKSKSRNMPPRSPSSSNGVFSSKTSSTILTNSFYSVPAQVEPTDASIKTLLDLKDFGSKPQAIANHEPLESSIPTDHEPLESSMPTDHGDQVSDTVLPPGRNVLPPGRKNAGKKSGNPKRRRRKRVQEPEPQSKPPEPHSKPAPKLTYLQFVAKFYPPSSSSGQESSFNKLVKYQEYVSGDVYFTSKVSTRECAASQGTAQPSVNTTAEVFSTAADSDTPTKASATANVITPIPENECQTPTANGSMSFPEDKEQPPTDKEYEPLMEDKGQPPTANGLVSLPEDKGKPTITNGSVSLPEDKRLSLTEKVPEPFLEETEQPSISQAAPTKANKQSQLPAVKTKRAKVVAVGGKKSKAPAESAKRSKATAQKAKGQNVPLVENKEGPKDLLMEEPKAAPVAAKRSKRAKVENKGAEASVAKNMAIVEDKGAQPSKGKAKGPKSTPVAAKKSKLAIAEKKGTKSSVAKKQQAIDGKKGAEAPIGKAKGSKLPPALIPLANFANGFSPSKGSKVPPALIPLADFANSISPTQGPRSTMSTPQPVLQGSGVFTSPNLVTIPSTGAPTMPLSTFQGFRFPPSVKPGAPPGPLPGAPGSRFVLLPVQPWPHGLRATSPNVCAVSAFNGKPTASHNNAAVHRTSSSLGVNSPSSLGVNSSSSLGVNSSPSLGVNTPSSLGINSSSSLGVNSPPSLGVNSPSSLVVNSSPSLGVNPPSSLGVNSASMVSSSASDSTYTLASETMPAPRQRPGKPPVSSPREQSKTPKKTVSVPSAAAGSKGPVDNKETMAANDKAGQKTSSNGSWSPVDIVGHFVSNFPRVRAGAVPPPVNRVPAIPISATSAPGAVMTTSSGTLQVWNQLQTASGTQAQSRAVRRPSTSPSSDDSFVSAKSTVSPTRQEMITIIDDEPEDASPQCTLKIQNVYSLSSRVGVSASQSVAPPGGQTSNRTTSSGQTSNRTTSSGQTSNRTTSTQAVGRASNVSQRPPEFISLDEYEEQTRASPAHGSVSQSGASRGAFSQSRPTNRAGSQPVPGNRNFNQSPASKGAIRAPWAVNGTVGQSESPHRAFSQPESPNRAFTQPGPPNRAGSQPRTPNRPVSQSGTPNRAVGQPRTPNRPVSQSETPNRASSQSGTPNRAGSQSRTPNRAVGQSGTPNRASSQSGAPNRAVSQSGTPNRASSQSGTPNRAGSQSVTPNKTFSQSGTPNRAASQSVTPNKTFSQSGTPNKAASQSGTPNKAVGQSVTPNNAATQSVAPNNANNAATQSVAPNNANNAATQSVVPVNAVNPPRPYFRASDLFQLNGTIIPATVTIDDDDEEEDNDLQIVSSSVPPKKEVICKCGKKHYVPLRNLKTVAGPVSAHGPSQGEAQAELVDLTSQEDGDCVISSPGPHSGANQGSRGHTNGHLTAETIGMGPETIGMGPPVVNIEED